MSTKLKLGDWIAISNDEIWYFYFYKRYSFPTKRDLIFAIGRSYLDVFSEIPHITKITKGVYQYSIQSIGNNYIENVFVLIRLNRYNIENYSNLLLQNLETQKNVMT